MKIKTPKIYLGVDWGLKKIGLAVGDDFTRVATPFVIVKDLTALTAIIKREKIDQIIVGEPRGLQGEAAGPAFAAFLAKLQQSTKLPIDLVDERLSTRAANNLGYDRTMTVRQNKKVRPGDDAIAAMLILQSYFDSHQ